MPKVLQNGLGKMGTAALRRFLDSGIEVVGIVDPHPSIEDGYKLAKSIGIPVKDDITQINLEPGTILVDFSNPSACRNASLYVTDNKGKLVIGTTPLPSELEKELYGLANRTAVMIAPNYSPEFNLFLKEMENVALTITPEDSVSIYERHRLEKVTTSGSAITIAKIFCRSGVKKGYILLTEGKAFNSNGEEIEMPNRKEANLMREYVLISYERFGDEPGLHIVRIGNENDYRIWEVRATRTSYAKGVEMAVRYIDRVEEGLVNFAKDVLKL